MIKHIFSIFTLSIALAMSAEAQVVVKKTDATGSLMTGDIYFKQDSDKDSWAATTDPNASFANGVNIANIQSIQATTTGSELYNWATYSSPRYVDYYINGSTWANRANWNLANIHDPSVMLAEDGYFYMYCTDAGYGNPHNEDVKDGKHGHFQCRRSKDLVNWEYMGATMYGLPSWVQPKLNEIRNAMGLANSTTNFSDDLQFGYWAPCARKVRDGLYRMYYLSLIHI